LSHDEEMSCQELVEVITDYLEGALPGADRLRFEQHLGDCPHCATYLSQMRATIAVLGELREESISPEARAELLEVFRGWRESA
jgi:anti-sigma factor RsiW